MKIAERNTKVLSEPRRVLASELLRNLTSDMRARPKCIENNLFRVLQTTSKDPLEAVRSATITCYYNLCKDKHCRSLLIFAGVIPLVVTVCAQHFQSVEMSRLAMRTLKALCAEAQVSAG